MLGRGLLDFTDAEAVCRSQYLATFEENVEYRSLLARMLAHGATQIEGSGELAVARGLLWQRTIRHFQTAEYMLHTGYYSEALIIYRSVFETLGLIEVFERFPAEAARWFKGDELRPGYVRHKLHGTEERSEIYDHLSQRSHPNIEALLAYSGGFEESGSPAHTAPWPAYLKESAEEITFVADVLMRGAVQLIGISIGEAGTQDEARNEAYQEAEAMWERLHGSTEESVPGQEDPSRSAS